MAEANKYAAGIWKRSTVTQGQMGFASEYNRWARGEASALGVFGKLFSLTDKRPYYQPAESPGHD